MKGGHKVIKFRLSEIMDEKNLTIQDVHEMTGISRNTISQMINKEPKGIQFDTLDKLLNNLNLTVDNLIKFTPNESKPFRVEYVSVAPREETDEFIRHGFSKEVNLSRVCKIRLILKNEDLSSTSFVFPVHAKATFDFEDAFENGVEVSLESGSGIFNDLEITIDDTSMFYEFLSKYHADLLEDIEIEIYELILNNIYMDYSIELDEVDIFKVKILNKSQQ